MSSLSKVAALFTLFAATAALAAETFTNPIAPSGADPWMIRQGGNYFLVQSRGGREIAVGRAENPVDIGKAPWATVWRPPPTGAYSKEIWAPELHYVDGHWYVYFAADDGNNDHHRIYVLEGTTQDPQDAFEFRGELRLPEDRWAIDGSLFTWSNHLYFIWSGWAGTSNVDQRIYITEMNDPLTPAKKRTCISVPQKDWEKRDGPPWINEGPEALIHSDHLFIIYSAAGSWANNYCLGELEMTGSDPLRADAWIKHSKPVFSRTKEVFGPGHCCFVRSPDDTEDWIIYHAAKYSGAGWSRNLRAQRFKWNADGTPDFGEPIATGVPVAKPADDTAHRNN